MVSIGTAAPQISRASVLNDGPSDNPPSLVGQVVVGGIVGMGIGGTIGVLAALASRSANAGLVCVLGGATLGAAVGVSDGLSSYHTKLAALERRRIGTSPDELAERDVLERFDHSGDGAVNIETESLDYQFTKTREVVRDGHTALQDVTYQHDYTRLFREIDTNGDGDVIKSEAAAAYQRFDANHSGGIDSAEGRSYDAWKNGLRETKTITAHRLGAQ